MIEIKKIGIKAKNAFNNLKIKSHKNRQSVLEHYNKLLLKNKKQILKENNKDIKLVKRKNLIDRLILDSKKIDSIRHSINEIQKFGDPLGQVLEKWKRPNQMTIRRISTPIGVIGVIYESRPNVTADVAALCIKTGNCSILRGGSEAFYSNKILAELFRKSLKSKKFDPNCVQFIANKNRKIVDYLLSKMQNYVDVIVPRGGKNLVAKVQRLSNVHVIGHLEGLCHLYIDNNSSLNKAKKIAWETNGVRSVRNDIKIKETFNFKQSAKDLLITSQLRTALILNKQIKATNYQIDTYKKKIYIYGISRTKDEKDLVITEAKEILDVEDVIASILLVDNLRIKTN